MKKHFKTLLLAQEYSFATQARIIPALAVLHNFIVIHDPNEISQHEVETEQSTDDAWSGHQAAVPREERTRAAAHRDGIAKAMWEEYASRPPRRRR